MTDILSTFLPFIVLMGIMYFMLIRPQKKQQEKKQEMLNAMQAGDHVITIGGLHGIVDEVNQAQHTVVLDCEGIYLTFSLPAIAQVVDTSVSNTETVVEEENVINDVEEVATEEQIEE